MRRLYIVRYNHGEDDPANGIKKVTPEFFDNPMNGFSAEEKLALSRLAVDEMFYPKFKGASHSVRRIL
jgi:hypothetical protein